MEDTMEKELKLDYTLVKRVVEISRFRLKGFDRMMKNITKFTKHLGLPEPMVVDLGTKIYYGVKRCDVASIGLQEKYTLDCKTITTDFNEVKKNANPIDIIVSEEVHKFNIEIIEEIIPDNEWRILGIIDHVEGLIKSAPNQSVPFNLIPSDLELSCDCEHCNTIRRRNKTIYVKNTENDVIKRVGGSCIKYYLGYDYERVLGFITTLNLFNDFDFGVSNWGDSEDGHFGGKYYSYTDILVDVSAVVKYFFWFVNNKGYVSNAAANSYNEKAGSESKQSSSNIIADYIEELNTPLNIDSENYALEFEGRKEAATIYNNIIDIYTNEYFDIIKDFIEEKYKENTFLVNSRNFFNSGAVKIKHLNYILSACSMYHGMKLAEERKNAIKKDNSKLVHIGVVGEKSKLEKLTIMSISGYDGGFGFVDIYKLEDDNGNMFTKFGKLNVKHIISESEVKDLEIGAILSFTADIKKHDEYRGVKQTILGRTSKL